MPHKNYQRGVWLERRILNPLKEQGYGGFRSAGSHSPVDVVVWNAANLYLIQCKHTIKSDIDLTALLKDDSISDLVELVAPSNAVKILCVKQSRSNSILQLVWRDNKWRLETILNI